MALKVKFSTDKLPKSGVLVLLVAAGGKWGKLAKELDKLTGGQLTRAAKAAKFTGKRDTNLAIVAPEKTELSRVILFEIGRAHV